MWPTRFARTLVRSVRDLSVAAQLAIDRKEEEEKKTNPTPIKLCILSQNGSVYFHFQHFIKFFDTHISARSYFYPTVCAQLLELWLYYSDVFFSSAPRSLTHHELSNCMFSMQKIH